MTSFDNIIQKNVLEVAKKVEEHLDAELEKLEKLDSDDLDKLRERRLQEMKKHAQQQQEWLAMVRHCPNCKGFL